MGIHALILSYTHCRGLVSVEQLIGVVAEFAKGTELLIGDSPVSTNNIDLVGSSGEIEALVAVLIRKRSTSAAIGPLEIDTMIPIDRIANVEAMEPTAVAITRIADTDDAAAKPDDCWASSAFSIIECTIPVSIGSRWSLIRSVVGKHWVSTVRLGLRKRAMSSSAIREDASISDAMTNILMDDSSAHPALIEVPNRAHESPELCEDLDPGTGTATFARKTHKACRCNRRRVRVAAELDEA